ncbi:MAG: MarR family winged helix-turn-helix transcriptional regulator [Streptosporangiaceae bacterium]
MVSESVNDAELERLLTQLLRVVSPALAGDSRPTARAADGSEASGHPAGPGLNGARAQAGENGVSGDGDADENGDDQRSGGSTGDGPAADAVSPSEARALIELVSARGIAQGELAGLLGLEKSTVSRLAAGLERKGWIRRGRDEDNQRYVRLYLTPEGRVVAGRVWAAWQSRQARILGALSAEERAGLSAGLRGLVRGLAAEGLLGEAPATASSPRSNPISPPVSANPDRPGGRAR